MALWLLDEIIKALYFMLVGNVVYIIWLVYLFIDNEIMLSRCLAREAKFRNSVRESLLMKVL